MIIKIAGAWIVDYPHDARGGDLIDEIARGAKPRCCISLRLIM
jgi:hypothetical protein